MKKKTVGFLGFGHMAQAIAAGISYFGGGMDAEEPELLAWSPSKNKANAPELPYGVSVNFAKDAKELIKKSDFVILACKPNQAEELVQSLKKNFSGKAIISILGGWDFAKLSVLFGSDCRLLRVMPNTPIAVGRGVALFEGETSLTEDEWEYATELFGCCASVYNLSASEMNAATALSGCGPAFLYMVIEALGDAAVKNGLSRKLAYDLAASTMVGAGQMALGLSDYDPDMPQAEHPGSLKDAVCSPGGSTIRGVIALEEAGMRAAFIRAVEATLE